MTHDISALRIEYSKHTLDENTIGREPYLQLKQWLEEAINANLHEPYAMNLATVSDKGRPSSRIVLVRNIDADGLVFFTNYQSRKGRELSGPGFAAANFYWGELERQVRVEGSVVKISEKESDRYFFSRPQGNRIGAWASPQSQVIPDRGFLETKQREFEMKFGKEPMERPPFWGGYLLVPDYYEFWQGRPNRLHDRISFSLKDGTWAIGRLAP